LYQPLLNSRAERQGFAKKNTTRSAAQGGDFFSANPQGPALTVSPGNSEICTPKASGDHKKAANRGCRKLKTASVKSMAQPGF